MKVALVFLVALSVAFALPADDKNSQIVRSAFDQDPAGPYTFNFETDNAILRDEVGELRAVKNEETNKDEPVIVMRGTYSYKDPEGKTITVTYYADETGFHAEGEHIPKAP